MGASTEFWATETWLSLSQLDVVGRRITCFKDLNRVNMSKDDMVSSTRWLVE